MSRIGAGECGNMDMEWYGVDKKAMSLCFVAEEKVICQSSFAKASGEVDVDNFNMMCYTLLS